MFAVLSQHVVLMKHGTHQECCILNTTLETSCNLPGRWTAIRTKPYTCIGAMLTKVTFANMSIYEIVQMFFLNYVLSGNISKWKQDVFKDFLWIWFIISLFYWYIVLNIKYFKFTLGDGTTENVFMILSGYSSRILLIRRVPMPEPVPPPRECVSWNPWRQSQLSASLRTTSRTESTSSAPSV